MKDTSINKWLIIIIILVIAFIIIPIILKVFNIKEGVSNRDVNNNVNQARGQIQGVKGVADVIKTTTDTIKTTTNDINSKRELRSGLIMTNDNTNTASIKQNDNTNMETIKNSIAELKGLIPTTTNTGIPVDFSGQINGYNTTLGQYNESLKGMTGQVNQYNENLNKGAEALTTKIREFNGNIVAYNTANLANASAVSAMDSSIKDTSGKYLATITPIDTNIAAINEKLQNFDPDALNRTMQEYNTANLALTEKILTQLTNYEGPVLKYKKKLNERLLISDDEE
jgi:hypothetical protein